MNVPNKKLGQLTHLLLLLALWVAASSAHAATRVSLANGNWNSTTTWTGGIIPAAGDDVVIQLTHQVTNTVSTNINTITFSNNCTTAALNVGGGATLTVAGAITLKNDAANSVAASILGAGSITCASLAVGGQNNPSANGTHTAILSDSVASLSVSGGVTITGQAGSGNRENDATLAIGSGTTTIGGTVTMNPDSSSVSTLTLATGSQNATLILAGATPFTTTGGTATTTLNGSSSTVVYSGAAQTVRPVVYQNLTLAGSGSKTTTTVTVSGKLSMQGTATASTAPTFTGGSTLEYAGSSAQTAGAEFTAIVPNLIITNAAGVTVGSTHTVTNLTLTAGVVAVSGTNQLNVAAGGAVTGGSSSSYVNGIVQKSFVTGSGQSFNFPVGDSSAYTPVSLSSLAVTTAGSIRAKSVGSEHPGIATSGLNSSRDVNRYWTLTNATLVASGYTATFNFLAGDLDGAAVVSNFAVKRFAGSWSATTAGTFTGTSVQITGQTTFGDFAAGDTLVKLAFAQQPTNALIGATLTPAVTVQLKDGSNANVARAGESITIALTSGSGALNGTLTQLTDASGLATFNDLSLSAGGPKQLTASDSGLTNAVSATFAISDGIPTTLVIQTQPSTNATAGVAFTQQPVVLVEDSFGVVIQTNLTVSAAINTGTGSLQGTTTVTAVNGVATFTDLSYNVAETITLQFTSSGLSSVNSGSVVVNPATASHVTFGVQPSTTQAGNAIAPAVTVQLRDQFENITHDTSSVSVAIGTNPGSATLGGTTTVNAVNGTATFASLIINTIASGYTLTATSGALTGSPSSSFDIVAGPPVKLLFTTAPQTLTAGVSSSVITVEIDTSANSPTNATAPRTINLSSSSATGVFRDAADTTTITSIVVDTGFSATNFLYKDTVIGTPTITAASTDPTTLTSATQSETITSAAAVAINVETLANGSGTIVPAQNLASGSALTVFAVSRDAFSNFVANVAADSWSLTNLTGSVVAGDLVPAGDSKSATLTGHIAGTANVSAAVSGLTTTTSGTITVIGGTASKLVIITPAYTNVAGVSSGVITVQLQDASGNPVNTTSNRTISLTDGTVTGIFRDVADTTTITSLVLPTGQSSTNYLYRETLAGPHNFTNSSPALAAATQTVTIIPAAFARFGFALVGTQAVNTPFNVVINAQDAFSNAVSTFTGTVDLSTTAGTITPTNSASFISGVVTQSVTVTGAGTNKTITATTTGGVETGTSAGFTVNPGGIDHLVVTANATQTNGVVFVTTVTAKDSLNNTVTSDSSTPITLSGTGAVQFDANGDGTYGDVTKNLTAGVLTINTLDNLAETINITATDTNSHTATLTNVVVSQSLTEYRSASSGVWTNAAIWQVFDGANWVTATVPPTNNATASLVTVSDGTVVTVTANLTIDQTTVVSNGTVIVNSGITLTVANGPGSDLVVAGILRNAGTITTTGSLVVTNGGRYQHAQNNGTIPTATWAVSSACEVTGWGVSTTAPTGLGQNFADFTWNSPTQTVAAALSLGGALTNVTGNFTLASSGAGSVAIGNTGAGNLLVGSNFVVSGGTLIGSISAARAVTVHGSYLQTGGTNNLSSSATAGNAVTFTVGGDFSVTGGALTESGSTTGSGITFGTGLHYYTNAITFANTVNFTVSTGAVLMMDTNVINGGGAFTLASGATLGLGDPNGITVSGTATGNVRSSGTRTLNSGASYIYNGGAAQITGTGLTSCANVTVSNTVGVTLSGNVTVSGAFTVAGGATLLGANTISGQLIINGTVAPGVNAVGQLTTGRETWNSGGAYNFEVNNATGAPGTGWDLLAVNGGIDLESTSGSPFTIKLSSLSGSLPGLCANFNDLVTNIWPIATVTGTVTNFSADKFIIDASSFSNALAGGTFSVALIGTNLAIQFTPVPVNVASSMVFAQQPLDSVAGTAIPSITVQLLDLNSNNYAVAGVPVTLSLTNSTGVLGGTAVSLSDGTGLVTFSGLSINLAGVKALAATSPGVPTVISTNFNILPAVAAKLVIATQPSTNAVAGVAFVQQPVVQVADQFGNVVTTDNTTIISAARDAGAGVLQGTTSATASSGSAAFTGLFHTVATNITIAFSAGGLTSVTSGVVTITPATATQLAFTTQPAGAAVAALFLTQPVVNAEDQFGNLSSVGLSTNLDLSLELIGGAAPLLGVTNRDIGTLAGNGTATFTNLEVDVTGTNYQLVTHAAGFSNAVSSVFTVGIQIQTITFGALGNKTYGDAAFGVSATASSGLPVTFSLVSNSPAILTDGTNITLLGAGIVTVRASQVGDTNWSAAPDVDQSFTVSPKPVTGGIVVADKVYDGGTTATITNYTLNTIVNGDDVSLVGGTASFADKNVSAGKTVIATGLSLVGTKATNYTLVSTSATNTASITARPLTISATGVNKQYDGTNTATVTLSDDRVSGDNLTNSYASAAFSDANVGTNKTVSVSGLSVTGTDAGNYSLASTTTTTTADISSLSVTGSVVIANKVYDGGTSATITNRSLAGKLGSDDVSLSGGLATFDDKNVGNGKTVITTGLTLTGTKAGNYTLASATVTNTANITARPLTVTATGVSKQYDGSLTATVTLSDDHVLNDDVTNSYATASFVDASVGTNKQVNVTGIAIGGADVGNYTLTSTSATTTASITAAALIGTVSVDNKIYDGGVSAVITNYLLAGVVGTDDVKLTNGVAKFADKNVGTAKTVITTNLTLVGALAANYTLASSSTTNTADITARSLTVSATGVDKQYDGTNTATVTLSDNRVSGDNLTNTYVSATFADSNVGSNKVVTVTGISVTGPDALNYTLASATATTSANITIRTVTGTVGIASKIYDGGLVATITNRALVGVVNNDDVSLSGGTASFATRTVGTGKTVIATGLSLAGTKAGNYVLASTSATNIADITVRTLTVSATGISKQYDGTTNATVTLSDDRVSGDSLTNSYVAAWFADSSVASGKTVTVTGISVIGADVGNYVLASTTATTLASITARPLTGSVTVSNKVYDATTAASIATYALSNSISGDDVSLTGGTANFTTASIGAGKTVNITGLALTGAKASNYSLPLTTATATASITVRSVTGSVTINDRPYDGTTVATIATHSLSNAVGGDLVSLSGGTATFLTASVGSNKTVNVTGLSLSGNSASNYTLVSSSATATANITGAIITVTADSKARAYGVANPSFTVNYVGFVNNEGLEVLSGLPSVTCSATITSSVAAGPYIIVVTNGTLSASNYNFSFVNGSLTVTQAVLLVKADDKTRAYGALNPVLTATITGFAGGETTNVLSGTPALNTAATVSSTPGGYPITAALGTLSAANYTFSFTNGTLTIAKAVLTVSAGNTNRVYGALNPAFTATYSGFIGSDSLASNVTGVPSLTTIATTNSPVNTYPITAALGSLNSSNYTFAFSNAVLSVTKAPLTVTADPKTRAYGAVNPVFTATITGYANGEVLGNSGVTGSAALSSAATNNSTVAGGPYPITATNGTLASVNYSFTFVNGFLTITQATSTMTISSSLNPAPTGSNVTLTATITVAAPGSGTPSGTVQFVVDGSNLGSPVLLSGGVGSVNTSSLSHGTHTVAARFAGDANIGGSTNSLAANELINSAPVAGADSLNTAVNTAATVTDAALTSNDSDPDSDAFSLTAVSATSAHGGAVTLASGTITYTPATNYAGPDSFTYTLTDSFNATGTGTVNVTVQSGTNSITGIVRLPDGNIRLTVSGVPGVSYRVLAATNIASPTWVPVSTNICGSNSSFTADDLTATNYAGRFYRTAQP